MLSKWPIRRKLFLGLGLLVLVVAILSSTGLVATYAYRNLVKSLSWRVSELPLAAELNQHVSSLRITLGELRGLQAEHLPRPPSATWSRVASDGPRAVPLRVRRSGSHVRCDYQQHLAGEQRAEPRISDHEREWETVRKIENQLARIRTANRDEDWMLDNVKIDWLDVELEKLQTLAAELPSHLHTKLAGFSDEVRGQYAAADPRRLDRHGLGGGGLSAVHAALVSLGLPCRCGP